MSGGPAASVTASPPPGGAALAGEAVKRPRARFLRQFELVELVRAYDPNADEALINRAYVFATAMHGNQKRHSGDPYFAHPIEVAGILTEYKLDTAAIVAGLLHDTIEDTDATRAQIVELFGEAIADLVEGVTKLSRLEAKDTSNTEAANLQKFILAISKDVRVLLVKLADRLHNMRTLGFHPKATTRKRIAGETLEIYAPLARRIGMDKMARELESLAFHEVYPDAETAILARVETLRVEKGANVAIISQTITDVLERASLHARAYGREKQPYSIWRKLQRKDVRFGDLADIFAFRVIVNTTDECYRALGLIHRAWRCVPEAFEDYVSNPKPNGYRSIHTLVIGPGNVRVEIQIRTAEMDEAAEVGVAAHWRYKNARYGFDAEGAAADGIDPLEAVRSLLEIAQHGGQTDDFIEHAKLEMYQDHVFAFTPKGRLIALPQGATPLDFAYAVHSDVGDTCIGALINGQDRPLRTVLRNGDMVEIERAPVPAPVPDWEGLTKTGRAKSAQRRLERAMRKQAFAKLGRDLVAHGLHRYGHEMADVSLKDAALRLGHDDEEALFEAVGAGEVRATAVTAAAFPGLAERIRKDTQRASISAEKARMFVEGGALTPGVSLHLGACCSPIPGDRIVGVQAPGRGVIVHTIDCEKLGDQDAHSTEWFDLSWTAAARSNALGVGRIAATVENARGVLAQLCGVIADHEGDILNIRTARRSVDFFDLVFDVEVADVKHLANIIAALRTLRAVRDVERLRQ